MEDISDLALHFVRRFARLHQRRTDSLTQTAMDLLRQHNWPGNIRELEDMIWNAVAQCEAPTLEASNLASMSAMRSMTKTPVGRCRSLKLQEVMEQHVLHVLQSCAGNKLRAAELLGISRSTLYRMLGESGQTVPALYTGH